MCTATGAPCSAPTSGHVPNAASTDTHHLTPSLHIHPQVPYSTGSYATPIQQWYEWYFLAKYIPGPYMPLLAMGLVPMHTHNFMTPDLLGGIRLCITQSPQNLHPKQ